MTTAIDIDALKACLAALPQEPSITFEAAPDGEPRPIEVNGNNSYPSEACAAFGERADVPAAEAWLHEHAREIAVAFLALHEKARTTP